MAKAVEVVNGGGGAVEDVGGDVLAAAAAAVAGRDGDDYCLGCFVARWTISSMMN